MSWLGAVARPSVFALCAMVLAGCGPREKKVREDWVIHSRIVFVTPSLRESKHPLKASELRLWTPYSIGDIYASPATGDFIEASIREDLTFDFDLNRGHDDLLELLEPTRFSYTQLSVEPANTRIARISPAVMEADGIEHIGRAEWLDVKTKQKLMLLYVDRAAKISGAVPAHGGELHFNVRVAGPGYVWVREEPVPKGGASYSTTRHPGDIVLAVTLPRSADET